MENDQPGNWLEDEFWGVDLGDQRRTERLKFIVETLARQPDASFPEAFGDKAELKAAYRFFDNPANDHEAIIAAHVQSTYWRMVKCDLVLAVQDTTYVDLTSHPQTVGLGPTTSALQQGLVVHSTLAFTPQRVVLGVLQQQIWARDAETYANLTDHKQRTITEKESNKWLISVDSVIEAHKVLRDTQFVSIGDREADVYDLFIKERPEKVDLLVRAIRDRRIEDEEHRYLWASLRAAPLAATIDLQVLRKQNQPARTAQLEIRWCEVSLRPPRYRKNEKLPNTTVWAVWAIEPKPPAGIEQIEWMLLCTMPIRDTEEALQRLDWYACRWGIEVWHKVLKSGCKIEARQLGDAENIKRSMAVFSVIAWRIMYAAMLARVVPDIPCSVLFEEEEWQALYCTIRKTAILPEKEPNLREAIRMVGQLGGFLGRKSDGEPGVKALWTGFRRLNDLTLMYKILRESDDG
jgi:hypothetical protein